MTSEVDTDVETNKDVNTEMNVGKDNLTDSESNSHVDDSVEKLDEYDLVVVGAGIQGAGIAQAAAINGIKTLVLEQYEAPAMGTSSKSSKLIHGGLRYLETLSFSLVRECLVERKRLLDNAPHLVQTNRFYIPVYETSKRSWPVIYLGLWLYAWLAGDFLGKKIGKLSKSRWSELSALKKDGLLAVLYYEDAQTDDKLLTEAVMKSYQDLKGEVQYSQKVSRVHSDKQGFIIETRLNQSDIDESVEAGLKVRAKNIINATGPWVNELASVFDPKPKTMDVDLVQGTHIIIDRKVSQYCFYGESPDDGRAVFVLPWKDVSMVGTTEKLLTDGADSIGATLGEVEYLRHVVNYYFPEQNVLEENISGVFAGSRVLPVSQEDANKRSRETTVLRSSNSPGYFAVYGGKLTAYRATAEKVVAMLINERFPNKIGSIKNTRDLSL